MESVKSADGTAIAALPHATVATLPGQGHRAHITAPSLLADTISRFLE